MSECSCTRLWIDGGKEEYNLPPARAHPECLRHGARSDLTPEDADRLRAAEDLADRTGGKKAPEGSRPRLSELARMGGPRMIK